MPHQVAALLTGFAAYAGLRNLFPTGQLPTTPSGLLAVSQEVRDQLGQARKHLKRWPSRASPGPNGSRFEHWGSVTSDSGSWEAAAQVVVLFALGEYSEEFKRANLGAPLFALRKPSGGIRPVACGSVLRRLAARTLCSVFREDIRQACGGSQFAVGRSAGCERVHKALVALICSSPRDVVLKFDCSNAFNTMPRQLILDAVLSRAPALGPVAASWLGLATTHLFWGEGPGPGRSKPPRVWTKDAPCRLPCSRSVWPGPSTAFT